MVTGGWLLTAAVLVVVVAAVTVTSATLQVQLPSYLYRQSGRDSPLKIRPKPCINSRGQKGQCMFVWDCIKGEGKHLGTCVDGFLFGSCCGHDVHENGVFVATDKPVSTTMAPPPSWTSGKVNPVQNNSDADVEVLRDQIVTISGTGTDMMMSPPPPSPIQQWTSISAMLHMTSGNDSEVSISGVSDLSTERRTTTEAIIVTPIALHLTMPSSTLRSRPLTTRVSTATTATTLPTTTSTTSVPTTITTTVATTTTMPTTWRITTRRTRRTTTTTTTLPPPPPSTTTRRMRTTVTTTTTAAASTMTMPLTTSAAIERKTMESIEAPVMVPSKVFHECGISAMLPQMRIVGGRDSRFGAWPWQVSVRRSTYFGFSSTHRCGGAVLNENWVATAGHCVADLLLAQIRIRVGEYDLSSTDEPQPFVEWSVQKKIVHPKYNADTYEHDLALVRLDKPLAPAENVAPICLPAGDPLLVGDSATITGWGRLKEGGTLPSVLQEVRVPIVSNKKCEQMFLATGRREKIPNFFICAGFDKGGKDSCQGDSGGPLQLKSEDGHWMLAGIISWGIGCGEPNLPGVGTRISKFREWILNKIDKEGA